MAEEEEPIEEEQEEGEADEVEDDKDEEDEEDEELNFYIRFTRALIFALPEPKDRILAASWVKKIKTDEQSNDKLKSDYIKLLIFALQRKKLVGIFSDDPTNYEQLEEFPAEYDLNAMAQDMIEQEMKARLRKIRRELRGQGEDFPPYTTDISANLREYVAAQDIPGFGVHCYYAISKDPITSWNKVNKGLFPKPAKSAVDTSSPLPPGMRNTPSGVCVECPGPDGTEPCNPTRRSDSESSKPRKKLRRLGDGPPVKPLVEGPQPEDENERKPPTWSSNLMDVLERERPTLTKGLISKERLKQMRKEQKKRERHGEICGDSELDEDYNEMERTIKDFRRGEISEQTRKRKKRSRTDDDDDDDDSDIQKEGDNSKKEVDFENFLDLEETEYEQEMREDSILVKYFRDTLNKRTIQKNVDNAADVFRGTLPAQAGIPLTTPKPSVSPRRLKASPPPFIMEDDLPREITKETDTTSSKQPCSYICSGRDPEMDKLFQQASALVGMTDDDLQADYADVCGDNIVESPKEVTQSTPEAKPPPYEPMQPIGRGSPAANKIFSEVVPPLLQQLQPNTYETPALEDVTDEEEESEECPPPPDGGRICRTLQKPQASQLENQTMSKTEQPPTPSSQSSPFPTASENRPEYIDYLFGRDRGQAFTIKRISNMVSDFEHNQPQPVPSSSSTSRPTRPEAKRYDEAIGTSAVGTRVCTNQPPTKTCRAPCAPICNRIEQKPSNVMPPSSTRLASTGANRSQIADQRSREGPPGNTSSSASPIATNRNIEKSSLTQQSRCPFASRQLPKSGDGKMPIQSQSPYFPQSQPQRPLSPVTSQLPTSSKPYPGLSQQKRICPTTAASRMLDFNNFKAEADQLLSNYMNSNETRPNAPLTRTPEWDSSKQTSSPTSSQYQNPELSSGMQQMLKRLPEAESYLGRCRGKRGLVYVGSPQTRELAPVSIPNSVPMSGPATISGPTPMFGLPGRDDRVNLPPTGQYSPRPVQGAPQRPCPLSLQRSQGGLPPQDQGGQNRRTVPVNQSPQRNPVPPPSIAGQYSNSSQPRAQGQQRQMRPCPRSETAGQNTGTSRNILPGQNVPVDRNITAGQGGERPQYRNCPSSK